MSPEKPSKNSFKPETMDMFIFQFLCVLLKLVVVLLSCGALHTVAIGTKSLICHILIRLHDILTLPLSSTIIILSVFYRKK